MEWELDVMRRERVLAGLDVAPTARWVLVIDGEAALHTAAAHRTLAPGDAVLVDARTAYRLTAIADTEIVHADLRQVVPSPRLPSPLVVSDFSRQHPGVAELISACPLAAECRSTLFAVSYAGLVGAAMTSSWLADEAQGTARTDEQVADVLAELSSRPGESWTLDRMADVAHLSRSALTDRFRRTVGRSPMQMVREVRMQQARRLLSEQAMPVTRIAFAVGYGSVAAFSRAFTAQHGVSPHAWRSSTLVGDAQERPEQPSRGGGSSADDQRYAYAETVQ
ncbi:helix-turn-helix transcriptional regulator [Nocardioidaceae bacterium SCSIO 66511]|nr:helix-turn-helix transcriptional regulator [Nocardioidaceae bacterium SCSIO 66511]